MVNFLIEIKEVLLVLATGIVSYFIAIHTTKSNAENLELQLQHNKALNNNQIKIDKLEDAIVKISLVHKELNILSLKLVSALKENTSLEAYKKEIKIDDIINLSDNIQRIAISLDIYALNLSKQAVALIKSAEKLVNLILLKDNTGNFLSVENIIQAKNNFHKSSKGLTIEITKHIREKLL